MLGLHVNDVNEMLNYQFSAIDSVGLFFDICCVSVLIFGSCTRNGAVLGPDCDSQLMQRA